ncbi:MAG TPA: glycoside hydrolase family 3 N-terminal domain-containing protein [Bacteroidales bacterium]|nr:glycoside hydrolase family 3 N-terminal domain-containing protein [Bacteroidales bacterium]HOK74120.1 glycoside hydrolase family 3 N-terminal domain-containing protein [Bacteroidales bacterium]HOM40500.1 glycoside hydrolase family 3 N-terminal domain-containing protein [Bacteroidales bacterium]HOU29767.1 glycoside hydrolase family 3 N-terminal domain-containing protein [Bacteroidales bacterium]HPP92550.1 glycoside hydrolase family 3 N-terminal domain-containing protein [Bacteroidales bacteri
MKTNSLFILLSLTLVIGISCSSRKYKELQPVLGTRSVGIIEKRGLKFRDLNKNGKLDKYEDWRLTAEERSRDLLSKMSVEEKAGLMMINTLNMVGTRAAEASGGKLSASDLTEGAMPVQGGGQFSGREGSRERAGRTQGNRAGSSGMTGERIAGMGGTAGTTKMVKEFHMRHFILRANESARVTAEWANKLQELCESEPLGIPALICSNPRNNITTNASLGTSVGTTVFSSWPGELGLSAMRDLELTREFADIARQEWVAVGIRKGYMYMADLATEPRWSRVNGTFGENAEWVAKMIREIVLGFQGEKLNSSSVALTVKHFPGGGSGEKGQDSHFEWGKKEVYPGGMFSYHLIPFQAAIDAGTSAIMPYYSLPAGTQYEEVGYAFNKGILTDLLRNQMGFKGIINSDTGPLTGMPWGVENLTKEERYKKAIEAGVNIFSGESDPSMLVKLIDSGIVDISYIDNSVFLLLKEEFELGLFENPYVDVDQAEKIVNNERFRERAALALRKSIVLLRNENNFLPLKPKTKVYFESIQRNPRGSSSVAPNIYLVNDNKYDLEFVKTPGEADILILWLQPTGNALFGSTGAPISLSLSKCGIDVDYVNKLTAKKPTVLVVNYTNPWVINEVYNPKTKNIMGVLATFGTTADALLDVITGKFNPSGKMPFATPVSDEAVENQKEDVPGFMEGENYALFKYDEGLSYPVR